MMQNWDWQQRLDFTALMDSSAFEMQAECREISLYKYYVFERSLRDDFLGRPTVKFATKTDLRDPFELTRRWQEFGTRPTLEFFEKYLKMEFKKRFADPDFLLENLAGRPEFKEAGLSRSQLRSVLETPAARARIQFVEDVLMTQMSVMLPLAFERFSQDIDNVVDEAMRDVGILSLTSDPTSLHMWDHYGGGGEGFVLEFDAQADFFKVLQGNGSYRNRLYKIFYRDERIQDFWQNPLYRFSVKNSDYEHEKEWRMLVGTKDCEPINLPNGSTIYIKPAPIGLISSITFGHKWNEAEIRAATDKIQEFDHSISAFKVTLDLDSGRLERTSII